MQRRRWLLAVGVLVAVVGGGWFLLRLPPGEAAGQKWVGEYVALVTSPGVLDADKETALGLFGGMSQIRPSGGASPDCPEQAELVRYPVSTSIVFQQRVKLERAKDSACGDHRVVGVTTYVRRSSGVTPAAVMQQLTERYGPPQAERFSDSIHLRWEPLPHLSATLTEPADPTEFWFSIDRRLGTPATIPDAAVAERWMDGFVALVTGEALRDARGPAAAALLGRMSRLGHDDCSFHYSAGLSNPDATELLDPPSASFVELLTVSLSDRPGETCGQARFSSLWAQIWRVGPVGSPAFAQRITARLGEPTDRRSCYEFGEVRVVTNWVSHGVRVRLGESMVVEASRGRPGRGEPTFRLDVSVNP